MTDNYRQPEAKTFSDALQQKVDALVKDFRKADVELIKHELKLNAPLYKKRAEIVSSVKDFWFQALINCMATNVYIDDADHEALSYLSNIEVERDIDDPRAATITFHFRENPYFSNDKLVKKFSLVDGAKSLEDEFNFLEETKPEKTDINWKSDDKNLVKLKPTTGGPDSDDFEPGSFFSTFFDNQDKEVAGGIGHALIMDFWPGAIDFYTGADDLDFDEDDFDSEDEEDDEDDDDAEIDLEDDEQPPKKKTKADA
ncbi:related to SET protein (Protein phosphatase 2A inhibitor) [Melanopsichium pennsylvanicum]|uniref:Related to SET protein (Protein phosphatase 2A inhibitor) n=2 Tax=Melanopsichium pennsylvanicum TaxID=63383 RepID=A0AAJ4XTG3_9BASI|nr:related to SET protein (Protein phosphatase 2A inhibitor) [Melanopsichium pennsylvanicum]